MGMSSYVKGVRDLDGNFKKMMEMKKLCDNQGFSYPVEVQTYFGSLIGESDAYIAERMQDVRIPDDAVQESSDDSRNFFDVDVSKIPKEVKTIRFVNSY